MKTNEVYSECQAVTVCLPYFIYVYALINVYILSSLFRTLGLNLSIHMYLFYGVFVIFLKSKRFAWMYRNLSGGLDMGDNGNDGMNLVFFAQLSL